MRGPRQILFIQQASRLRGAAARVRVRGRAWSRSSNAAGSVGAGGARGQASRAPDDLKPVHGPRSAATLGLGHHSDVVKELVVNCDVLFDAFLDRDSEAVLLEQVAEPLAIDEVYGSGSVAGRLVLGRLREVGGRNE